jgi:hypothetical protein
MKTFIDCYQDSLCVVIEESNREAADSGTRRSWYPVRQATAVEGHIFTGRPTTQLDPSEGTYIDEEGNVYQLKDKGATQPIAVEHLPGTEKTELESLLEASLNGENASGQTGGSKRLFKRNRGGGRRQPELQVIAAAPEPHRAEATPPIEPVAPVPTSPGTEDFVRLNLRQKLAEVRRRIGYIQKRGHNERFNYSYVTAADIAGSVGDILSELGVVVIPSLENITYESAPGRGETTRMAQVVMAYTFSDVDSGEEIVAKVAGQGLDTGDKAPYKAMTGALKYALLQSFLLATGDDPEDERMETRLTAPGSDRPIGADEVRELERLIGETETDLERVLAYYKVASLGEMNETTYQRAIEVLKRKLAKTGTRETVHAQD